jgi:hypothetical protein
MTWIKTALFVGIVVVVTIKICDLALAAFGPAPAGLNIGTDRSVVLREFNPNQQTAVSPNPVYLKGTDAASKLEAKRYVVRLDDNGYIHNGNPQSRDDKSIKILFLGGSTTESLYVDERKRWPSVVERTLRIKLGEVVTHNAGVSGNNIMHSLIKLISVGLDDRLGDRPDYAVMMHNVNDFAVLTKGSYWAPARAMILSKSDQEIKISDWKGFLKSWKDLVMPNLYSYLKPRLPLIAGMSFGGNNNEWEGYEAVFLGEENIGEFRSALNTFVSVARAWGITPVLMTQPNRIRQNDAYFLRWASQLETRGIEPEEFIAVYDKFNDTIKEVAEDTGAYLIDLAILVPPTSEFMYDQVHYTGAGSELVGKEVSQALLDYHVTNGGSSRH